MSASRTYARAAWSVALPMGTAMVMLVGHSPRERQLLLAIIAAAIWLLGWQMPRLLQTLWGAVLWVCRLIGRLLRSYVSAILLAFVCLAAARAGQGVTGVSQPSSWLHRPTRVHVRTCGRQTDSELLHSCLAASGYLTAAVLAALGWCLRRLPESAQSGRIPYGTYTLQ